MIVLRYIIAGTWMPCNSRTVYSDSSLNLTFRSSLTPPSRPDNYLGRPGTTDPSGEAGRQERGAGPSRAPLGSVYQHMTFAASTARSTPHCGGCGATYTQLRRLWRDLHPTAAVVSRPAPNCGGCGATYTQLRRLWRDLHPTAVVVARAVGRLMVCPAGVTCH